MQYFKGTKYSGSLGNERRTYQFVLFDHFAWICFSGNGRYSKQWHNSDVINDVSNRFLGNLNAKT